MGQEASCNKCSFSFLGGHDHHTGISECVCTSCLTYFALPTASVWGPEVGERIQICRYAKSKKKHIPNYKKTGSSFITTKGEEFAFGDQIRHMVEYPIEEIPCPECNEKSLKVGFEEGDNCPKCSKGKVSLSAIIF